MGADVRRQTFYFMIIEVVDPQTGAVQTIKSDPYRIPLQKYIGSPYVQVYTDRTGWKHVVDGFQLKEREAIRIYLWRIRMCI